MKRLGLVAGMFAASLAGASAPVVQNARELPLVRDADVVVVGGGSAAVAAAIAAKTNGASVFLVAPRTYLGDDLAGTRELWPSPVPEFVSHPLARQLFTLKVPFTYSANATPDPAHTDNGGTRLTDGVRYSAASGSVQYNTNVVLTLAFAGAGTVTQLDLYYYYRAPGGSLPFNTAVAGLAFSSDGSAWSNATISVLTEELTPGVADPTYLARITVFGGVRAKYLRLACNLAAGVTRQLLDEIVIHTSLSDPLPGSSYSTTPLALKRSLEAALVAAGIPFLGGSPVTAVLKDANGDPSGVVLANRTGRQAVTSRVVIDATENAWPAQQAGASKTAFAPGAYSFSRIVIADATNAPAASGLSVEALPGLAYQAAVAGVTAPAGMPASVSGRVYRCTFSTNLLTGSMTELLEVEQTARDLTWAKTCLDQADRVTWLPPDHIVGAAAEQTNAWPGAAALNLDAFRPLNVPCCYVLGVRADVPRTLALELQNPARLMALADRVGAAAAAEALARGPLTGVSLPADTGVMPGTETVSELLAGLPPVNTNAQGSVAEGIRALPVLAECEVLVVGAGTGGAPAAIAAGRAGADTVVIEFLNTMGGVQTDGRIGLYYHGNACGFTLNDVDPGCRTTGAVLAMAKAEWYRRSCREAGVRVLFGTLANGAVIDAGTLRGIVVVLPDGQRGVIRAKTVVDATGNADIAAAAGEETEFITSDEPAVQGAGWAQHVMGNSYMNSDVGFVYDADVADLFFFARRAHASMPEAAWDAGQSPASRERRRLKGVFTVTPIDILNNRTYPDTIVRPVSNFDSHGFTVHDLFFIQDPGTGDLTANLPYRALLPKTLDGLLVTGLGMSAHRDAMPLLRMQRDVQNQGYAAGYASALSVRDRVTVRNVDMAALQAHLVVKGIIGASHTNTADNFPLAPALIQTAVEELTNNYATLHTVLADTATSLPMLRAAFAATTEAPARLIYAHVLGLLNDPAGAETLASAVNSGAWDTGWNFKGMGQYGRSVSLMDSYIIALGRTLDPRGVAPVLDKASLLSEASAFSHYRAVSLALEKLDGGSSITRLSALLAVVRGHALTNALATPLIPGYSNTEADTERNRCLKELAVARALFRLGDDQHDNGFQVLSDYASDPREVYGSHARQVLANGPLSLTSDGIWTGTETDTEWDNAANWQDGARAGGVGAAAYFTNAVSGAQTISLQGSLKNIGALTFGGADRTVSDGVLDISGTTPSVTVGSGIRATLAADVTSLQPIVKNGAGELTFAGSATLGGMAVTEGDIGFSDPSALFFQAYAADPTQANTSVAGNAMSLRTDFRVNRTITVTHLGAYDSGGDGFENFKKVALFARTGGAPLAALAFANTETYPLENGYRFRRLPEPLRLEPGDYAVVTFGLFGQDRIIEANKAGTGAHVGFMNDGNDTLTFLTGAFYTQSGALTFPTTALTPQTEYAVTAGSFRYATGTAVKRVTGPVTLPAGSTLDVGALDVRLTGGLLPGAGGLGTINAAAAYPVTLTLGVPAGATNHIPSGIIGDLADRPLTLIKSGPGLLKLTGQLGFNGGISVGNGVVEIDSPEALGDGDLSFGTSGKLELQEGGRLERMVYVANQAYGNDRSTRLVARSGSTVTLTRGIEIPRAYEFGGFAIQPHDDVQRIGGGRDDAVPLTRVNFDGARLGYLDLYLLGDALPGTGRALHYWTNVRGGLRKLASGNETVDGCDVVFGAGCDFSANWFDLSGTNAVVSITNGAVVRSLSEVRFVDGNQTQLSLDGGVFQVGVIGVANANNQHLSLVPVLFNGTVVRATYNTDVFFHLSEASAAPLIRKGGAFFDTQGFSVAIRGKGFAQEPGSTGAFVKQGEGTLKIATPMAYTGTTLISNGTVRLDFSLWSPTNAAQNLLPPTAEVNVSAGAALEVLGSTNAAGAVFHRQSLGRLVNTETSAVPVRVEQADLAVNMLAGAWIKTGPGSFAIACGPAHGATFAGALTVREGLFAVRGWRTNVTAQVPYPGFESSPLLSGTQGELDKRGSAATNCPGWTFITTDAGYQRNGSYFSATAAAYTTNGVQTAFVRRNGAMETTLLFPTNGTYVLMFRHCSRYYNGIWYTNHIVRTSLGGEVKDAVTVTNCFFAERVVSLGYVASGTRTLRFTGSSELPAPYSDPCTLIDDIRITGVSDTGGAGALSSDTSSLTIASGVRVELDYPGAFSVGELVINGVRYRGGYYGAETHPEVFMGTGLIHPKAGGTNLLLR